MPEQEAKPDVVDGAGPAIVTDEVTGRSFLSLYRYQVNFETEFDQAAFRMIKAHGTPTERFALWFVGAVGGFFVVAFQGFFYGLQWIGVQAMVALWITGSSACVVGLFFAVALWWGLRGRIRFRERLVRQRLCFDCGYALIGQPIDDDGQGRCPECGATFDVRRYLRPPKRYHQLPRG